MKKCLFAMILLSVALLASCRGNDYGNDYMVGQMVMDTQPPTTMTMPLIETVQVGEIVRFGSHEWRVLAVYEDDTALIITENIIGHMPYYHTLFAYVVWENSDARKHLNGDFFDSFTQEEQNLIWPRTISTPNNEWFGTRGGDDTVDYIFLLSIEETVRYFGDSGTLSNPSSSQHGVRPWLLYDEYNSARVAVDLDSTEAYWWLRSSGFDIDFTAVVSKDGSINLSGNGAGAENGGLRPALFLMLP